MIKIITKQDNGREEDSVDTSINALEKKIKTAFSERLFDSQMPFYHIGIYAGLPIGYQGEYQLLKVPVARRFGPNGTIKIRTINDRLIHYGGSRFVRGDIRINYPLLVDKQDCVRKLDLIAECLDKFKTVFEYHPPKSPDDIEKRETELRKFAEYISRITHSLKE